MHLKQTDIIKSPIYKDKVRLIGEVSYDNKDIKPETYWFEIPKEYTNSITDSGNPWLICLIPLAVTLKESLTISKPIDHTLYNNILKLMTIWKIWYPDIAVIPIEANINKNKTPDKLKRKNVAFFSGGIDSFFTILHNNNNSGTERAGKIEELINVWGFDIPLNNSEAFHKIRDRLKKSADEFNKNLIDIATNLRDTTWRKTRWGYLSHGCALASTAFTLEHRYNNIFIASSASYEDMSPWGSHMITDPLLSSSKVNTIYHGAEFNRIQKTELVSQSKIARQSLHICYVLKNDENCGKCGKCYRAMITLELYKSLDNFATFKNTKLDVKKISKMCRMHNYNYLNMNRMLNLAISTQRNDIAKAIKHSIKRSKKLEKYILLSEKIEKWMYSKRFIWRWASTLRKAILKNSIT